MNNGLKKIILIGLISLIGPIGHIFVLAEDLTTSSFILRDSAITIMGGRADSTGFQNVGAGGQLVIGEGNSVSYIDQDGILYFSVPVAGGGEVVGGGGGSSSGAGPAPPPIGASVGIIKKITQKIFGCNLTGDLNKDCQVNIYDVSILLYGWGQREKNPKFLASLISLGLPSPDFNNDSKVDIKDLSLLLFNWTG